MSAPLNAESMQPQTLRLLLAVAETGSISAAARRVGMSQPSATARLARLERSAGVALLRKSTKGSALTVAGQRLLGPAQEAVAALDRLAHSVAELRADDNRGLQIAASYTIGEYLFNRWLSASRIMHQGTQVGLEVANSTQVCAAVVEGRADLGFIESPAFPQDVDTQAVAHDELVLVVAPTHPWARMATVDVRTLASTPLVWRERGSGTREYGEQRLTAVAGECARPVVELGSTTAVKEAVAGQVAPALMSRLAILAEVAERRLVEVPVSGASLVRDLRAVLPRGQRPSEAAQALIEAATTVGVPAKLSFEPSPQL